MVARVGFEINAIYCVEESESATRRKFLLSEVYLKKISSWTLVHGDEEHSVEKLAKMSEENASL